MLCELCVQTSSFHGLFKRRAGPMLTAALVTLSCVAHAQLRSIKAELTAIVESDGVHAGKTIRAALQVRLPKGFHVQSNKPRDPLLIPTVLDVGDAPAGVSPTEIVFPAPTDLTQIGQSQPLAVFEEDFAIGVQMELAGNLPPGEVIVPLRLRYQACDETICYGPVTADARWTLRIVPASAPVADTHRDVIDRIAFGHGEAPHKAAAPVAPRPAAATEK